MGSTDDTIRLARRVPEEIATGKDLDLVPEIFADEFVGHGPFGREFRGVDGARENLESVLGAFPDMEATVEEIIGQDDLAAMRVTLRGTHQGEFMGIPPTGNSFEVENMVFTRVRDGKIFERWVLPNTLSLLQQLGVVPDIEELRGMSPR